MLRNSRIWALILVVAVLISLASVAIYTSPHFSGRYRSLEFSIPDCRAVQLATWFRTDFPLASLSFNFSSMNSSLALYTPEGRMLVYEPSGYISLIDRSLFDGNWHFLTASFGRSVSVSVDGLQAYQGEGPGDLCKLAVKHSGDLRLGCLKVWGSEGMLLLAKGACPRSFTIKTSPMPGMPLGLADLASVYLPGSDRFLLFGGYTRGGGNPTSVALAYDVKSGVWQYLARMPLAEWGGCSCYYPDNRKVYLLGGLSLRGNISGVYEYDPFFNYWRVIPGPSIFRGSMCAYSPDDGRIHVITERNGRPLHLVFDPINASFSEAQPPPVPVRWGSLTYYDRKLYLVSGTNPRTGHKEPHLIVYDISSDEWELRTPPPFRGHGMVREWGWLDGRLYVVDFYDGQRFYGRVYSYNESSGGWRLEGYTLYPRDGVAGGITKDGFVLIFGGRNSRRSPRGLSYVEKLEFLGTMLVAFSPSSNVYGFVGDKINILVLSDGRQADGHSITVYLDGNPHSKLEAIDGRASLIVTKPGVYRFKCCGAWSNKMVVVPNRRLQARAG